MKIEELTQDFIKTILNPKTTLYFINYTNNTIYADGIEVIGEDYCGNNVRSITYYPQFMLTNRDRVSFWSFKDFGTHWSNCREDLLPTIERYKRKKELEEELEELEKWED